MLSQLAIQQWNGFQQNLSTSNLSNLDSKTIKSLANKIYKLLYDFIFIFLLL